MGDDIGQGIRKQNDFLFQEWTHSFVPKEDIYYNEAPGLAIEPLRCCYGAFYIPIPCGRNYFVKKDGAERLLCRDKSLHLHLVY